MLAGWTLGAWSVVVIVPALLTAFSIFYYIKGDKNVEDNAVGKEKQ